MVMVSVRAIMSHGYGTVAPEVAEVGSVFLRLGASMSTKECARLFARARFWSKCASRCRRSTFERWGRKNVQETVVSQWALDFTKKRWKNCHVRSSSTGFVWWSHVKSALLTLRECWSIWCGAPAMRVCNRWQNAMARLCARKRWWCCHSPAMRDCSRKLRNAVQQLCM